MKEKIIVKSAKKEYPEMTFEEVEEMVKKLNEEARANALPKTKEVEE